MARRTIHRNPLSVDTDDYDLNEQYFNFSEFKGINSNKNYVGIDQQTFVDAKNMYVDQDGQLATRPTSKRIDILPADEKVISVVKVNNLVIYQTLDDEGKYWIRFYIDKWYEREVTEKFHVTWYKDKYILFTENNLEAWSYNYDTKTIKWYVTSQIIYTPVSQIISGSVVTDVESDNIFTSGRIIRYDFESGKITMTDGLEGKTVNITIGDEVFENVQWKQNMEIIFTKPLGSVVCNRIFAKSPRGNEDSYRYFAYNMNGSSGYNDFYISLDGNLFVELPMFDGYTNCTPVLSEDGLRVLAFNTEMTGYQWDGLWYYDIPSTAADIATTSWVHIWGGADNSGKFTFELNAAASGKQHSTRFTMKLMSGRIYSTAHAPTSEHVVFVCGARIEYWDFENEGLQWVDPKSPGSAGTYTHGFEDDVKAIVICNYTGSGSWSGWQVEAYPLYRFVSSPTAGYEWHQVRYTITNDNRSFITLFTDSGADGNSITPYTVVLKSDYTPYFSIEYVDAYEFVIPILMDFNINYHVTFTNSEPYGYDVVDAYVNGVLDYYFACNGHANYATNEDIIWDYRITNTSLIAHYDAADYVYKYVFTDTNYNAGKRGTYPVVISRGQSTERTNAGVTSNRFKLSYGSTYHLLTDKYFVFGTMGYTTSILELLQRPTDSDTKYDIIPIYVSDDGQNFGYYSNNTIYTNNYEGHVYVDYNEDGTYNYYVPEFSADLIDKVLAWSNTLYWTSARMDDNPNSETYGTQLLYVSSQNVNEFEDIITNLITFSQTSLGVFLSNSVYEFQYSETLTNSLEQNSYILTPTKLQMGCKKGSSIIIAYSSSQILLTNIKGLTVLTYQDFVQSTEQIFSYLTDSIMNEFYKWATGPIKLYQYKDWLFVYQQDNTTLYVYDVRNSSWWKWELLYPIQACVTVDEELQFIMNNTLYQFDFDTFTVYDDETEPFDWYVISQKLHFNAPNYYKVVKQLSIITTQPGTELRYKLTFKNYHNIQNLVDSDTVEYDIDQLNTLIKRVTFMKLNAFQFAISNDKTNPNPTAFATSDIAIQFRITERVR